MNKIETLEKTIYNLENNLISYNWKDCNSCNCGVLAATLLGTQKFDIFKNNKHQDPLRRGVFANKAYCLTTGQPLNEVFQALKDAGFTHPELLELEYLSNPAVVKRGGLGQLLMSRLGNNTFLFKSDTLNPFAKMENLIEYLKIWVEILKEDEKVNQEIEDRLSAIFTEKFEKEPSQEKHFEELLIV